MLNRLFTVVVDRSLRTVQSPFLPSGFELFRRLCFLAALGTSDPFIVKSAALRA